MVWLYERENQTLRVETLVDNLSGEYVVTTHFADGGVKTDRFLDIDDFHARLVELEHVLESDRWNLAGPPTLLPGGWPPPRAT